MKEDRLKWNEKYRKEIHPVEPAKIVKEYYRLAPRGLALDIATGNGRNALFLAKQGFEVIAVDIADEALTRIGVHPRVHPLCQDLDSLHIPQNHFSLWKTFSIAALKKGGYILPSPWKTFSNVRSNGTSESLCCQ